MYKLVKPIFFALDPETAHKFFINLGKILGRLGLGPLIKIFYGGRDKQLATTAFGLNFPSPIGLAAGFDKNGELAAFLPALGFGFLEIGTITPRAQLGNPKPRLFRLPKEKALINRMGFNNQGASAVAQRLQQQRYQQERSIPIGINIGKNKDTPLEQAAEDYEAAFAVLAPQADFVVVNVSSPNTPNLRSLQEKAPLTNILLRLQQLNNELARPKPILLKIAPDLTNGQLDEILEIAQQTKIAGIVATNTTIAHEGETGGLSGQPLKKRALEVISYLHAKSGGSLTLIGSGGVASAQDAYNLLQAGATLVEVYTAMIYEGPSLIKKINQDLAQLMKASN